MASGINSLIITMMAAVSLPLFFSCARPAGNEAYVLSSGRGADGAFSFPVAMDDSAYTYNVSFFVTMACRDNVFDSFTQTGAEVLWMSPSGRKYAEKLVFGRDVLSSSKWDMKTLSLPYREGLVPVEFGEWEVQVFVDEEFIDSYDVTGMGLRLQRKKQ